MPGRDPSTADVPRYDVTMAPINADFRTLYFGFGFEGVTSAEERNELMGRAIDYLLVP